MGEIKKLIDTATSYIGAEEGSTKYTELVKLFNTTGYKYDGQGCCEIAIAFFIKALGLKRTTELIPISNYSNAQAKKWSNGLADYPVRGALVYFDYKDGKGIQHVELVIDFDNETITTIDGNSYHTIVKRNRKRNYRYIAGYGIPKFKEDKELIQMDFVNACIESITIKKGNIGSLVLWAQKYLQSQGYYLNGWLDGVFGETMEKAVKEWQADQGGLIADGVIGKFSLMRMLK